MAICKFCGDRGCIACAGERKKHEAKVTERALNWQPPSKDTMEIAAALLGEAVKIGNLTPDEAQSKLIDIAMPPPLFTARTPADMDLLATFAHRDILEELYTQADGDMSKFIAEFAKRAESARVKQAE